MKRNFAGLPPVLLGIILLLGQISCSGGQAKLQLGDRAPDFTAVDQHGNEISLSEYVGGPVVIRFWSVDCKFCRADTPVFNEYYRKYREQGLMIIYISRQNDPVMVKRFIDDLKIEFPVVIDVDGEIARQYRVKLDPQAIFIDPQHKLTAAVLGGVGEAEMKRLLGGYLK